MSIEAIKNYFLHIIGNIILFIVSFTENILRNVRIPQNLNINNLENQEFIRLVELARQEMLNAERFFEEVNDPDLVDYAIYSMEAARKRYVYLLKQARMNNIRINYDDVNIY